MTPAELDLARGAIRAVRATASGRGIAGPAALRLADAADVLLAEIERLRAEMSLLTDANIRFGKRQDWWNDRMFELEQKIEQLRLDAGRYRWLRERAPFWAWQPDSNCYPGITVGFLHSGTKYCDYTLDEAIDAAMKEAK